VRSAAGKFQVQSQTVQSQRAAAEKQKATSTSWEEEAFTSGSSARFGSSFKFSSRSQQCFGWTYARLRGVAQVSFNEADKRLLVNIHSTSLRGTAVLQDSLRYSTATLV
jgi:hypothetical protein